MKTVNLYKRLRIPAILCMMLSCLFLDTLTQLNFIATMGYVCLVLTGTWFRRPEMVKSIALISSIALLVGLSINVFLFKKTVEHSVALSGITGIWLVSISLTRIIRSKKQYREQLNSLVTKNNNLQNQLDLINSAAIISITNIDGIITEVNDTFCKVSGYSEEELLGKNHRILKSGEQPEELYSDLWETISRGNVWQGDLCNKRKDGTLYWVNTLIAPFRDKKGRITQYVSVRFDITDLRRTKNKLRYKANELILANKKLDKANKELETFSYSVSHDLKAPLRAMQGFSKNLSAKYSEVLDETGIRWLNFIQNNAERMDQLIQDILNFSRINKIELNKSNVDMNTIVREQIKNTSIRYPNEKHIEMTELPVAYGDYSMLEMVWQNLIDNAFKYSGKETSIEIKINGHVNGEFIHYSICDNGAGFEMKYYDKIFTIFQRLHGNDEFEGTGVGLANVKRIIEIHGGTIEAYGEPDRGAKFMFTLPKDMKNDSGN